MRADPFQHHFVSSLLCPPAYQSLTSPSKPVAAVAQQASHNLQLHQPQLTQQQYVPVSMVEQSGRQVLLAAAQGPPCWPANARQMTLVPSWQQLAPGQQHSAAVQPATLLQAADPSDWSRHLLVDQSGQVHHQDQRSIFPVELPDVYDSVSVVDHWSNSKRGGAGPSAHKSALFTLQAPQPAHLLHQQQHQHHTSHMQNQQQQQQQYQPQQQRSGGHQGHMEKKDSSVQLSPVKKRVKESSPPQQQHQRNDSFRRGNSPQHWQQQQQHYSGGNSTNNRNNRQPTITIEDTPSPAVSVITISDSDDEGTSSNKSNVRSRNNPQNQQQQARGRQV